jgi:hypothetical protein
VPFAPRRRPVRPDEGVQDREAALPAWDFPRSARLSVAREERTLGRRSTPAAAMLIPNRHGGFTLVRLPVSTFRDPLQQTRASIRPPSPR